jgi:rare lipoprotein A
MRRRMILAAIAALLLAFSAARAEEARAPNTCTPMVASWYGTESGNRTANGEHFDGSTLTAAHKTLPFGTRLRVSYRGRSVVVRINDRGPFIAGRDLDLARAAADRIGMGTAGVARVCGERLK